MCAIDLARAEWLVGPTIPRSVDLADHSKGVWRRCPGVRFLAVPLV